MLIGTVAISGIPPLAGFFSKDEILAYAFQHGEIYWAVGFLTALFTAFYMFRLLFLTFFGEFRGTEAQWNHLHESPWQMTVPLAVLAVLSTVGGLINLPEALGGHHALAGFLEPVFAGNANTVALALSHSTEYALMGASATAALLMAVLAYVRYVAKKAVPQADGVQRGILHRLSYRKLYVDECYNTLIVKPLKATSVFLHRYVDRSGIDGFVNGVGRFFVGTGQGFRLLQSGYVGFYVIMMVGGIIALLLYGVFGS